MALLSEKSVIAHGYILTAFGKEYGGASAFLVLDNDKGGSYTKDDFNASGFDCGSIRGCFATAQEAEARLADFQSGKLKINPHREIDPAHISIRRMVLEVHAVHFTDEEHEFIPVLGAFDSLKYGEKSLMTQAFPELANLTIAHPDEPGWKTLDGNTPRIRDTKYRLVPASTHAVFNQLADQDNLYPPDVLNALSHSAVSYRGLTACAEEVGKAHIGIEYKNNIELAVHISRVYSYDETFVPPPPPPPRDLRAEALAALSLHPPVIGETIVQAAMARRLRMNPAKEAGPVAKRLIPR